jgi:hypothetical protein
MGNSIVGSDSEIYVHISSNRFVKKAAEDVNVGDQVLFRKEFVSTTISDVDKVLDRSLRYRHAKELLHEENNKGRLIKKQRTFLIRGLAQSGVVSDEDLEARVLKEVPDFTPEEYEAMREEVFALINPDYVEGQKETRSRSRSAIDTWLRGKTIAIMVNDWNLYRRLDELNPEFKRFDENDKSKTGYFWNYRLLVVTRRVIKKYLDECKGAGKGGTGEKKPSSGRERISVGPEIQLVVNHFMEDIDEQYVATRVTSVKDFVPSGERKGKRKAKPDSKLSAGVVTNRTRSRNVEEVDMLEVVGEYELLDRCFMELFIFFGEEYLESEGYAAFDARNYTVALLSNIFYLMDEKGNPIQKNLEKLERLANTPVEQEKLKIRKKLIKAIQENLFTGAMDTAFGWSEGAFLRLFETIHKIRQALPRELINHENRNIILQSAICQKKFRQRDKHLQYLIDREEQKIRREEHELGKKYGLRFTENHYIICPKELLHEFVFQVPDLKSAFWREMEKSKDAYVAEKARRRDTRGLRVEHFVTNYVENKDYFTRLIKAAEASMEKKVYRRNEVQAVLDKYGLGELIGILKHFFVLDDELGEATPSKPPKKQDRLEQRIKQTQRQRKKQRRKFTKESTVRHRKIMEYLMQHLELIEPGLELVGEEYRFPTHDRIDLVFRDSEGKFLTVEVEYVASGNGGMAGLEQAVKYKHMFVVDNGLEPEDTVRGMLVAVRISDDIRMKCEKYSIEYREVPIPEEAISVPKNTYQTLSRKEITLQSLSPKEQSVYERLLKFNGQGDFSKYYEQQIRQVFNPPSKTKLQRLMERLKQTPLYQIYLDLEKKNHKSK